MTLRLKRFGNQLDRLSREIEKHWAVAPETQLARLAAVEARAEASLGRWTEVLQAGGAGTSWGALNFAGSGQGWVNVGAAASNMVDIRRFLDTEWAVTGYVPKLRVRGFFTCNNVAPGTSFDFGLYEPASPGAAGGTISFGSFGTFVEATFTTPAANSMTPLNTAEVSMPSTAKNLCLGVQPGGAATAGHRGLITLIAEMRHVAA